MRTLATTPISVLDLAKVPENGTIAETYHHSRELAQHVERLGYHRFWLAEHHNLKGIASAATPLLIGYIAENTKTIRVGSGGIMLPNHSPLIVAEQFGTLATLYPRRIDLGLGRAPGTDPQTMRAIRQGLPNPESDFESLISELLAYFGPSAPNQKVHAIPGQDMDIPIFILGSSLYSARLAAKFGRPYAFAGHFAPRELMAAFQLYRAEFKPSAALQKPYTIAGVPVVAAETNEQADFLATSLQQAFLGLVRGDRGLARPPVHDMNSIWTSAEKDAVQSMLGLLVTGCARRVRDQLDLLVESLGIDELIIMSDTYSPADRLKSYEVIMESKCMKLPFESLTSNSLPSSN